MEGFLPAARCAALLLQALMLIPSGLAWAQAPGGAAHFYTTLRGIHVAGYQGWFACPGDGAKGVGWGHWFRGGGDPRDPSSLAIDLWPDTGEVAAAFSALKKSSQFCHKLSPRWGVAHYTVFGAKRRCSENSRMLDSLTTRSISLEKRSHPFEATVRQ